MIFAFIIDISGSAFTKEKLHPRMDEVRKNLTLVLMYLRIESYCQ